MFSKDENPKSKVIRKVKPNKQLNISNNENEETVMNMAREEFNKLKLLPQRFNASKHLSLIYVLSKLNISVKDQSKLLNVTEQTFHNWKRKNPLITEAQTYGLKDSETIYIKQKINNKFKQLVRDNDSLKEQLNKSIQIIVNRENEIDALNNELSRLETKKEKQINNINKPKDDNERYLEAILEKQKQELEHNNKVKEIEHISINDPGTIEMVKKTKVSNERVIDRQVLFHVNLTPHNKTDIQLARFLSSEKEEDKQIRWGNKIYYTMQDYFNSETDDDRKNRYVKGQYTKEEIADYFPSWL